MNVQQLAELVRGVVKGDPSLAITGVAPIDRARPGEIAFVEKKKYFDLLKSSGASAVLVAEAVDTEKTQIVVANPRLAFARILAALHPELRPAAGVHPRATLGQDVVIGQNVTVAANAVIGDGVTLGDGVIIHPGVVIGGGCRLGQRCVLHPNVVLYRGVTLGNRVIVHAGAVIGADGFGYTPDEQGRHFKINQIGGVIIGDDVEIGANTCIDRATLGVTHVKAGVKIDNLVQIAHNCTVGEHSILVAQAGVAGSCSLGRYVVLAGQAGVADHVTLGDHVTIAAKAGALRDVESNQAQGGTPSIAFGAWKRYVTILPDLPEHARKIRELEKRLEAVEKARAGD